MRIPHPEGGLVGIHGWDGSSWKRVISDTNGYLLVVISNPEKGAVGIYGWNGTSWQKLVSNASGEIIVATSSPSNAQVGICGFDGTNWQKVKTLTDGEVVVSQAGVNTFRFRESIVCRYAATSTGTEYTMYSDTVPANEYWVINQVVAWNLTRASTGVTVIYIEKDTTVAEIYKKVNPAQAEFVTWQGEVIMQAGQKIRVYFSGIAAGDALRMTCFGFKIGVP